MRRFFPQPSSAETIAWPQRLLKVLALQKYILKLPEWVNAGALTKEECTTIYTSLHASQLGCFLSNIDSHIQYSRPLLGKVKTFTIVESEVAPRNAQCSVAALVFLRALVRTLVMGVTTIPLAVPPVIFSLLLRTSSMFVTLVFLRALGLVPIGHKNQISYAFNKPIYV